MTKEEIQGIVSQALSEMGNRREADQKEYTKLSGIVAYLAIASFAGGIVLFIGDARIDQKTRAFANQQIIFGEVIKNIHKDLREIKDIVKQK